MNHGWYDDGANTCFKCEPDNAIQIKKCANDESMKVNNKSSVRCANEIDVPAVFAIVIHVPALCYWFELLIFLFPNIYVWQPFSCFRCRPFGYHRHCASDPLQFCCYRCRRFGYHRHTHCITDSLQFCCFIISTVAGNGRCVASSTTARSVCWYGGCH